MGTISAIQHGQTGLSQGVEDVWPLVVFNLYQGWTRPKGIDSQA